FYFILFDNTVIDTQYVNAVDESVLSNSGEEIVERHLLVDGFSDESDTVVRLIPPSDSGDSGRKVLEIGLGGGSFDMALHKIKRE
ncbi:hypothetical protein OSTOST_17411, partial [Ostertagia ostertagi]